MAFFVIWIDKSRPPSSVFENLSLLPPLAVHFHGSLHSHIACAIRSQENQRKIPRSAMNQEMTIFLHATCII